MKKIVPFLFTFIFWSPLILYTQVDSLFIVKENHISKHLYRKQYQQINRGKNSLYEDSLYIVTRSCSGEWGGTIRFTNKRNNVNHVAASTCPVIVNMFKGKYYITNSSAHLQGKVEILEIDDPDSLQVEKEVVIRYVGDGESKSKKGVKVLADSIGIKSMGSFFYKEKLYHLIFNSSANLLNIAIIKDERFETITTLFSENIWTNAPESFITEDGDYFFFFKNSKAEGLIRINGSQVFIMKHPLRTAKLKKTAQQVTP